jgi:hypothetical protein
MIKNKNCDAVLVQRRQYECLAHLPPQQRALLYDAFFRYAFYGECSHFSDALLQSTYLLLITDVQQAQQMSQPQVTPKKSAEDAETQMREQTLRYFEKFYEPRNKADVEKLCASLRINSADFWAVADTLKAQWCVAPPELHKTYTAFKSHVYNAVKRRLQTNNNVYARNIKPVQQSRPSQQHQSQGQISWQRRKTLEREQLDTERKQSVSWAEYAAAHGLTNATDALAAVPP